MVPGSNKIKAWKSRLFWQWSIFPGNDQQLTKIEEKMSGWPREKRRQRNFLRQIFSIIFLSFSTVPNSCLKSFVSWIIVLWFIWKMLNRFLASSVKKQAIVAARLTLEILWFKYWTKLSEGVLEFELLESSHDSGVIISKWYGTPNVNVVEKRYKTFMRV